MTDFYQILNLTTDATDAEIKSSYRRMAKENHPDINQGNPYAEARFKTISEAYQTLSNKEKRRTYDAERQRFYNEQNAQRRMQEMHERYQQIPPKPSLFDSPVWGRVKTFASDLAQSMVEDWQDELHQELQDVNPLVYQNTEIQSRENAASLSVTAKIPYQNLKMITQMSSMGMDLDDFTGDVGLLVAQELGKLIKQKWRRG